MFYKREKGICRVIKVSEAILIMSSPTHEPCRLSDSAKIQLNSETHAKFVKITSFSPD